jgi:glutamate--cysteine ligase
MLHRQGKKVHLKEWATEIVDAMAGVCTLLDADDKRALYTESLTAQAEKVRDPDCTPSARMLAEMRSAGEGFFHFALRMSQQHQGYFRDLPKNPELQTRFVDLAEQSWAKQRALEAASTEPFAHYLQRYFAQTG